MSIDFDSLLEGVNKKVNREYLVNITRMAVTAVI